MRFLAACFILACSRAVTAQGAHLSDYPNRPVRLIVTVPPGGAADFIARFGGGKKWAPVVKQAGVKLD